MKIVKTVALSLVAAASLTVALSPASAHRHQVCHMERHHGHATRACHWVG
jgi:hypothetical protein